MASKEELFDAVKMLKMHCTEFEEDCEKKCPLSNWCDALGDQECANPMVADKVYKILVP